MLGSQTRIDLRRSYGRATPLCPIDSSSCKFHDKPRALRNVTRNISVVLRSPTEHTSFGPIRTISPVLSAEQHMIIMLSDHGSRGVSSAREQETSPRERQCKLCTELWLRRCVAPEIVREDESRAGKCFEESSKASKLLAARPPGGICA